LRFEKFAALIDSGVGTREAIELSGVSGSEHIELLEFAISTGAVITPVAKTIGQIEKDQLEFQNELKMAGAVPKATRRLMLWLPGFGIIFGELLGLKTISALSQTLGLIAFLIAVTLIYVGSEITQKMISKAGELESFDDSLVRLQILLSAGLGIAQARGQLNLDSHSDLLELATKTGAKLSGLLSSEIEARLERVRAESLERSKELSVRLMIPLGLTTLPAFLLFTLTPMLIGLTQ